jgi:riboflavin kinase/FMN adenylyltransferase
VRCIEGFDALEPGAFHLPVCSVGVFDGVHRGHRQLLYELRVWAQAVGGEACVITFPRHPLEILKEIEVAPILTLENRLLELERHEVDAAVLLDFASIRGLGAEEFLKKVILERMGCSRLLLGFDSHVGKDRSGGPANLPSLGKKLGMEVRVASPVLDKEGRKIGSSSIRRAIAGGDLPAAANVLGRPVSLRGEVIPGARRGSRLGIATANLDVAGQVLPPDGVYLVRVFRGAETAPAVANLGVRPTFENGGARLLEVHVPGWSGEMYGEVLEVRLVRRLRDERQFESAAELRQQIAEDLKALKRAMAEGEI